jgi:succinoglycan biosynthesis protein ExoM
MNVTPLDDVVSVCICTYRRPSVIETIKSVFGQKILPEIKVELIVCDDDPQQSAFHAVSSLVPPSGFQLRYIFSGSANVAVCRNKCLSAATGEWIYFVDDDQLLDDLCLQKTFDAQKVFLADVVKARVQAVYPLDIPPYVLSGDYFSRDYGPTGASIKYIGAGGVLIRASIIRKSNVIFDPVFSKGGEDVDFFYRMVLRGAKIISCREAVVHEIVPRHRVEPEYLRGRSRDSGRLYSKIIMRSDAPADRLVRAARALVVMVWSSLHPLVRPISPALSLRMACLFGRNRGVLDFIISDGLW